MYFSEVIFQIIMHVVRDNLETHRSRKQLGTVQVHPPPPMPVNDGTVLAESRARYSCLMLGKQKPFRHLAKV